MAVPDVHEFLETKVKSQGKQEENDPDVSPNMNILGIHDHGTAKRVGACDNTCHDIAQHDRLF